MCWVKQGGRKKSEGKIAKPQEREIRRQQLDKEVNFKWLLANK
jgi:hypothetical protein